MGLGPYRPILGRLVVGGTGDRLGKPGGRGDDHRLYLVDHENVDRS